MLSLWLIAFNLERLWVDGNLSFFRGKRGTDLALVVVMLPALEQLVPDTIARLEHACSPAGQLDPACSTRVSFDASSMPWCHGRSVRA